LGKTVERSWFGERGTHVRNRVPHSTIGGLVNNQSATTNRLSRAIPYEITGRSHVGTFGNGGTYKSRDEVNSSLYRFRESSHRAITDSVKGNTGMGACVDGFGATASHFTRRGNGRTVNDRDSMGSEIDKVQ